MVTAITSALEKENLNTFPLQDWPRKNWPVETLFTFLSNLIKKGGRKTAGSKENGERINSPVYKLNNHIGI